MIAHVLMHYLKLMTKSAYEVLHMSIPSIIVWLTL
jgi:hypothetical protein